MKSTKDEVVLFSFDSYFETTQTLPCIGSLIPTKTEATYIVSFDFHEV